SCHTCTFHHLSSFDFVLFFFFSSRRRHTRFSRDWSSDVCSSDLAEEIVGSDGVLHLGAGRITDFKGNVKWQYRAERSGDPNPYRSEERRVGKECRSRWSPYP